MIKYYKKFVLSIGLFMGLLSRVSGAAINASIGQELAAELDKTKAFIEGMEHYSSEDLTNIRTAILSFFPCCRYLSAMGDFFPERSIEAYFMKRPDLLFEFISQRPEAIRCVTLGDKLPAQHVTFKIHTENPEYDKIQIRITLIVDNPFTIAHTGGDYSGDDYLILKHGDDFMPLPHARVGESIRNMRTGDQLTLLNRSFIIGSFIDLKWRHLYTVEQPSEANKIILRVLKQKLKLPEDFLQDWLSRSLKLSELSPDFLREWKERTTGLTLLEYADSKRALVIFPAEPITTIFYPHVRKDQFIAIHPYRLTELEEMLPEGHPVKQLLSST